MIVSEGDSAGEKPFKQFIFDIHFSGFHSVKPIPKMGYCLNYANKCCHNLVQMLSHSQIGGREY